MQKVANSQGKLKRDSDENLRMGNKMMGMESEMDDLKGEVTTLKRQLKESQAKRNMAIKQLSEAIHKN